MDLAQLRAFIAVVDAGGVSRAAETIHLSQPALSRQLQMLEGSLGVSLFSREQRRMRLTSAGEDLLRRARGLVADAEAFVERAKELQSGSVGLLRLGATPPTIEALLAPFLIGWSKRHPGIELHIIEDGGSSLAERLDCGDVHIAYVPAGDPRFHYKLLYPIHVVAALPQSHALARSRCLEITRLDGLPLLALRSGFGSRDWFDKACHDAGFRPRMVLDSASHGVILALTAAGYGIGILPSAVAPRPVRIGLRPLLHDGVPIGQWTMLAWSKRRTLPKIAHAFLDEFSTYARTHYPGRSLLRRAPEIPLPREHRTGLALASLG